MKNKIQNYITEWENRCNSYHELKRVELAKRNKPTQLKLF